MVSLGRAGLDGAATFRRARPHAPYNKVGRKGVGLQWPTLRFLLFVLVRAGLSPALAQAQNWRHLPSGEGGGLPLPTRGCCGRVSAQQWEGVINRRGRFESGPRA